MVGSAIRPHRHGGAMVGASVSDSREGPEWDLWRVCEAYFAEHGKWPHTSVKAPDVKPAADFLAKLRAVARGRVDNGQNPLIMAEARKAGALQSAFRRKR